MEGAHLKTTKGREEIARPNKFAGSRGGRGSVVLRRGGFTEWLMGPTIIDPTKNPA